MSTQISAPTITNDHREIVSKRSFRRLIAAFVVGLIASQSIGCCSTGGCHRPGQMLERFVDRQIACYRDRVWAERAYNLRYGDCERQFGDHFRKGFVAGYCNICDGKDGYVPAMPPQCYWSNEYQCPEGAKCVNAWFEGFPAGAQAAKKDSAGTYRDVYISNMINAAIVQEGVKDRLPSEVPINQASSDSVPPPTAPSSTALEHSFMSPPATPKQEWNQPTQDGPKSLIPLPDLVQPTSAGMSFDQ